MSARRVTFVNRFYAPDHSATSQILTDLAQHLAAQGWGVSVITSRLVYGTAEVLPPRDVIAGVAIVRVPTSHFGNANLPGRALDYLSFYVSSFFALLGVLRRGDVVVAKTDPPLISVVTAWAAALKGARLVNWLQDLYPEIAFAHGVKALRGTVGRLLTRLRNESLRAAAMNVAICDDMASLLKPALGNTRLAVIHNWSDDVAVAPMAAGENALRREWDLMARFVVGYSGNLGRAHDWLTFLHAAEHLRERPHILFLMIGGGAGLAALKAEVTQRGLQASFRFEPYQPKSRLNQSLGLPDVHLISQLPEFRGLVFPSKLFGVAAAGRGVIAVTDTSSELAQMIRGAGCGEAVGVGDGVRLGQLIEELAGDPGRVAAWGRCARRMLENGYRLGQALDHWEAALVKVADDSPQHVHLPALPRRDA